MSQNITTVPIYDVQQAETIMYILNQTKMKAIACSAKQFQKLINLKSQGNLPHLNIVILFSNVNEDLKADAIGKGLSIYTLEEVANLCQDPVEHPPRPSSIYTICYTSGTTGMSKGAMISHSNLIATIAGAYAAGFEFKSDDSHLSYLPLAHMLERMVSQMIICFGGSMGFYSGDVNSIRDDLVALKPTIFVSVPRLYNRFYDLIIKQFNSLTGIKRFLTDRAITVKTASYHADGSLSNKL